MRAGFLALLALSASVAAPPAAGTEREAEAVRALLLELEQSGDTLFEAVQEQVDEGSVLVERSPRASAFALVALLEDRADELEERYREDSAFDGLPNELARLEEDAAALVRWLVLEPWSSELDEEALLFERLVEELAAHFPLEMRRAREERARAADVAPRNFEGGALERALDELEAALAPISAWSRLDEAAPGERAPAAERREPEPASKRAAGGEDKPDAAPGERGDERVVRLGEAEDALERGAEDLLVRPGDESWKEAEERAVASRARALLRAFERVADAAPSAEERPRRLIVEAETLIDAGRRFERALRRASGRVDDEDQRAWREVRRALDELARALSLPLV